MRISILSIGRARGGAAMELYRDYVSRLPWEVSLKELQERRKLPPASRMTREAELLTAAIPKGAVVVALDERGKQLTSEAFAKRLGTWIDQGRGDAAFLIGGADGLSDTLRARADLVLSLGPMTWPHLLVRALLAEQLYRAFTIRGGHPYHRG